MMPGALTYTCLLNACAFQANLTEGKKIHQEILNKKITIDPPMQNALISMYSKCGDWPSVMQFATKLNTDTSIFLLNACAEQKNVEFGNTLHSEIRKQGIEMDLLLYNALISMYAKFGDKETAFNLFEEMKARNVTPNASTYVSLLTVCTATQNLKEGHKIYAEILQKRVTETPAITAALIALYGKNGDLEFAQTRFENMAEQIRDERRRPSLWNAMMDTYLYNGQSEPALRLFTKMEDRGVTPNETTYVLALEACGNLQDLATGRQIHEHLRPRLTLKLQKSLIDMYTKCGVTVSKSAKNR
jgi:pentatricopeptide repeat protein